MFKVLPKKLTTFMSLVFLISTQPVAFAQSNQAQSQQKPKMNYLGQFDAGSPNAGIFKMYDPTDEVLCYILMPEVANRKLINNVMIYEANSLGSISCLKVTPNVDTTKTSGVKPPTAPKK